MSARHLSRNRPAQAAIAVIGLAAVLAGLGLTNTRLGVYILLDYFGDDESDLVADPRLGPVELSEFVTAVPAYTLPLDIDQPSGISYLQGESAFAIVTDQAELFVVSEDFETIQSETALAGGLLVMRQGTVESAGAIDEDRLAVTGESGRIDVWRKGADLAFSVDAEIEVSGFEGEAEFSGVAYNPQTGEYYLSSDEALTIYVVDPEGRVRREISLETDLRGQLKSGRSLNEYQLSGLDFSNGLLFAVSETYNTIFTIDPAGGLTRTIGIEGGDQISDIAVHDNRAYLPIDHNHVDERPPLFVAELQ